MMTLVALGGLVLTAMLAVFVLGAVLLVLKAVLLLVLLPFKLVGFGLRLLFLPIRLLLGLLFLPILLVGGILGLGGLVLAALASILVPLAPLVLIGVIIWALVKAFARPPAALVR